MIGRASPGRHDWGVQRDPCSVFRAAVAPPSNQNDVLLRLALANARNPAVGIHTWLQALITIPMDGNPKMDNTDLIDLIQ